MGMDFGEGKPGKGKKQTLTSRPFILKKTHYSPQGRIVFRRHATLAARHHTRPDHVFPEALLAANLINP